jgi:hypothetical protein
LFPKILATDFLLLQELGLPGLKDRQWHVCKSNALKGEGLTEGLDWVAQAITGTAEG